MRLFSSITILLLIQSVTLSATKTVQSVTERSPILGLSEPDNKDNDSSSSFHLRSRTTRTREQQQRIRQGLDLEVHPQDNNNVNSNDFNYPLLNHSRSLQIIEGEEIISSACDFTIPFDLERHKKQEFVVGVLAIRGFEAAMNDYNKTFAEYLTATAGQRFDPPISFRLQPLNFVTLFSAVEARQVDFIYVNPSAYSCIESEYEAHSLASQVSRRKVDGNTYGLKKFGGVIATLSNRTDIESIQDLKDKKIAAASISGLGSGQMQFKAMVDSGMSYLQDPSELIFTSNQGKVVQGLLSGDFDVGFIRTDQLERSKDTNGNLVNRSLFKVIDPVPNLAIDGEAFPFESSTELYAEWNIASLTHVSPDVAREVQRAMLSIGSYGTLGDDILDCYTTHNKTYCDDKELTFYGQAVQCNSSRSKAVLAADAMRIGKFAAWSTTLSYMPLRSMQEATGFISMEPDTKIWRCVRSTELYDAITCPAGFEVKSKSEVDSGCAEVGLGCKEGFQCVCRPCVAPNELICVDSVKIGDECVSLTIFLPVVILSLIAVIGIIAFFYLRYKKRQLDSFWLIDTVDLTFDDPPVCVGEGKFGLILLADYRGTQVAVKRVLPPRRKKNNRRRKTKKPYTYKDTVPTDSAASNGSYDASNFDRGNPGLEEHRRGENHLVGKDGVFAWKERRLSKRDAELEYERVKKEFILEIRYLAKMRHPNICTVMGAAMPSNQSEPMLVMEYMNNGSLEEVVNSLNVSLEPEQLLSMLQDVAQGLRFLHSAKPKIIHGDLKAKNILVDSNFTAKLSNVSLPSMSKSHVIGTPFWMSPEILAGTSGNTTKSDIYSYGILIYEVYSGQQPYRGEDYATVVRDICDPVVQKRPTAPVTCPPKVALLMQECLRHSAVARPDAEQLDLHLRVELKVTERTGRLEKLNEELKVANEHIASASAMQLQHFAAMSHEIRTPLNCIIGISSLLEESNLDAMQKESIDMIVNSGRLLRSIVDDVLDYSKLESGNAETLIERVDLQETLDVVVHMIKTNEVTKTKKLKIQTVFDPLLPQHVEADSRRTQQILYNLLGNAIKFSRPGQSVQFVAQVVDRRILRYTIKDFGKGIAESDYNKIFIPFRQTETGLTNVEGGTGLGLAITKKLVEALRGRISVESVVGQWTEFTVDFPFSDRVVSKDEIAFKLSKTHVLIVANKGNLDAREARDIFTQYGIKFTLLPSMHEMGNLIFDKQDGETFFVCLCQEDLFESDKNNIFEPSTKYSLVTFGPDFLIKKSPKHIRSILETFPSVLAMNVIQSIESPSGEVNSIDASARSLLSTSAPWASLRVLVAEDNLINQKVMRRMLERLEVEDVTIVDNGEKAVQIEAEQQFDLVLMDMQMPVLDGVEACKQINKRLGGHPIAQIVFVTAHAANSFKQQCIENGAIGYITKPCTKHDVEEVLRQAIMW
eukprot:CAMPEP_0113602524 /NCGR_PEP_ID=MMETSP0017_2-20120614/800_1 /TAXON_ID=2856 /ORGANISM="Cylindrotheca closterium" /LENGTH=1434 /DNA_ID=CAMNT_0000510873 /DNA_START=21 /DNA_END=4322 /DNA_ORIENTATION=- /assembly_acc=CAM_ASM_000147